VRALCELTTLTLTGASQHVHMASLHVRSHGVYQLVPCAS
jgi:hypothetical protein